MQIVYEKTDAPSWSQPFRQTAALADDERWEESAQEPNDAMLAVAS
jgi:hypothetical protein